MHETSVRSDWPLVGRDHELATVARAHVEKRCGVVIRAGAGVGKSRLGREVLSALEHHGAMTEWVQATRSAAMIPLGAFARLLPPTVRPEQAFNLLRESGELLRERAAGRPIVLGVDDAQLLDPASAALVLHVATRVGVFVVATVRSGEACPDAIVALWKDGGAQRLELERLSDEAVRTLVEAALGGPVQEEAQRWVLDRSQGNPLYARELVLDAVDSGRLVADRGLWRLAGAPSVAASLVELVGARIDELTGEQRAPVELLALAEPLTLSEIERLTSYDALADAESHGLISVDTRTGAEDVRLAHPLYGDVLRASMPGLRCRALRLRLATTLQARCPLAPDDALRVVRLLLDAGAPVPPSLLVDAARAANLAGDPALGAQLGELAVADGGGVDAVLALARANSMRGAFEEAESGLAAIERELPGHPSAVAYLEQRIRVLFWGLGEAGATRALLDRASTWSAEACWQHRLLALRMPTVAGAELAVAIAATEAALADRTLDPDDGPAAGDAAGDLAVLRGALERGVHARPPAPAGHPDPGLHGPDDAPRLPLRRGRVRRRLARADGRAVADPRRRRPLPRPRGGGPGGGRARLPGAPRRALPRGGALAGRGRAALRARGRLHLVGDVHMVRVGIAAQTGDTEGADRALERLRAVEGGGRSRTAYLARAEGWARWARNPQQGAAELLAAAERFAPEMPGFTALLAHDALLAGASPARAAALLAEVAPRCDAPLVAAYAAHADALARRDGPALLAAAERFADIGARRYAMHAAQHAATRFVADGRQDSARRAAARARDLHEPGHGTEPPVVDGLDSVAVVLTARESQLVGFARQGLGNAEIADRLVLSIRTVETHLYRAMQKLGVSDRRDL